MFLWPLSEKAVECKHALLLRGEKPESVAAFEAVENCGEHHQQATQPESIC